MTTSLCQLALISAERKIQRLGAMLVAVRDNVVQDVDDEEGTSAWTREEGVRLHVPIPTAAHIFRLASADAARRTVNKGFGGGTKVGSIELEMPREKVLKSFVEDLHKATYVSFLVHLIKRAGKEHGWGLDFTLVMQLWRGGCIT
jgi:6-phosphogluconate dehydrogenase